MKAVVQSALGQPADVLEVIDIEDRLQPGPDEVLIDVTFAPVHHGDLALIRSLSRLPEDAGHVRRGSEAVGPARSTASARRIAAELAGVHLATTDESGWQGQVGAMAAAGRSSKSSTVF